MIDIKIAEVHTDYDTPLEGDVLEKLINTFDNGYNSVSMHRGDYLSYVVTDDYTGISSKDLTKLIETVRSALFFINLHADDDITGTSLSEHDLEELSAEYDDGDIATLTSLGILSEDEIQFTSCLYPNINWTYLPI
jgi:hypothetical protein